MMRLRPIRKEDTTAFIQLAMGAGAGVTSLPKNRQLLEKKIEKSLEIFADLHGNPSNTYLFIVEDTRCKDLLGTSGILALSGGTHSMPLYRIDEEVRTEGHVRRLLVPIHPERGPSELCGLYLNHDHRQSGHGKLTSLGRFLFIAQFKERFTPSLNAMMRGNFLERNISPFWEAIGRKFCDLSLEKILYKLSLDKTLSAKVIARFPLYIDLLPIEAQQNIQAVHLDTLPAFNFLIDEGFHITREIDIIDAGPKLQANITDIRSIKNSVESAYKIGDVRAGGPNAFISNCRLNFRAVHAPLDEQNPGPVVITQEVADALELGPCDPLRYFFKQSHF